MKLCLIRGPSGTGKSTIAREIHGRESNRCGKVYHYESDQFFVDEHTGTYRFNVAKLSAAHKWNQLQVERAMLHESPIIIVSNTFIAHWEMEHYMELAEEYRYEVQIIRSPGPWSVENSAMRNKHSVPLDVLKRHINSYQPHDTETEWTDMSIFQHE